MITYLQCFPTWTLVHNVTILIVIWSIDTLFISLLPPPSLSLPLSGMFPECVRAPMCAAMGVTVYCARALQSCVTLRDLDPCSNQSDCAVVFVGLDRVMCVFLVLYGIISVMVTLMAPVIIID